jgi:hypothetical protein
MSRKGKNISFSWKRTCQSLWLGWWCQNLILIMPPQDLNRWRIATNFVCHLLFDRQKQNHVTLFVRTSRKTRNSQFLLCWGKEEVAIYLHST